MNPSQMLYRPQKGALKSFLGEPTCPRMGAAIPRIEEEMRRMMAQPNYPCVAALQAYHRDEYQVGVYRGFGSGKSWSHLRGDLLYFLSEQQRSQSVHLTFWATFPADTVTDEDDFEKRLWQEISFLTSEEDRRKDWPTGASTNPQDPKFCLGLGGHEFFVVGLHPNSSRLSRRFPFPTLIFNVFDQFQTLQKRNQYDAMVKQNRLRDEKFQGEANPMATQFGETWESVQFSGKKNSADWKCPFRFVKAEEKAGL